MARLKPTYDEYFAYIVLKEVVKIDGLKLSDMPDLVNEKENFGIEIVNAIPQDILRYENEYMKLYNEIYQYKKQMHQAKDYIEKDNLIQKINKKIDRFNKLCAEADKNGYNLNSYFMSTRVIKKDEVISLITNTIKIKTKKKINYQKLNDYQLYINTRIGEIYDLCDFTQEIKSIYNLYKNEFSKIYFYLENENKLLAVSEDVLTCYKINNQKELISKANYICDCDDIN